MEKTGRNEPCPCGSGKKYKKCHGAIPSPEPQQPAPTHGPPKQSEKQRKIAERIPWASFGRESIISRAGRSLVPVGVLPFEPKAWTPNMPTMPVQHPDMEKFLMNIVGTAIQADRGKLVTCAHVVTGVKQLQPTGYFYILSRRAVPGGNVVLIPYRVQAAVNYYFDPRTGGPNKLVDLAMLISVPNTDEVPYEIPNVKFGDSSKLGVGDPVIIGGYPHGKDMFLWLQTNRGIVQPTFYSGIVSAIIPATKPDETRLLQIAIPSAGGMSGGAVFLPNTGEVVGMITSGIDINDIPQPMSYAIPSEILAPYVEVITFETDKDKQS
jgi:S1-C subfamily serine protease